MLQREPVKQEFRSISNKVPYVMLIEKSSICSENIPEGIESKRFKCVFVYNLLVLVL